MKTITPEEYAEANHVHLATVYRRINAGKIPVVYETRKVIRIPVENEVAESQGE